jgi:ubiquinone/menaquinone biosynthesis C-methylase UbiE
MSRRSEAPRVDGSTVLPPSPDPESPSPDDREGHPASPARREPDGRALKDGGDSAAPPSPVASSSSAALAARYYDAQAARLGGGQALERYGTLADDPVLARMRDKLEKAHLERVLELGKTSRVLDLGGGAGRLALWLAPRVGHVTLVDVSRGLLEVAKTRAARLGLHNVETVQASALEFEAAEPYDLVLVSGVAAHLDATELGRLAEACGRLVRPGGQVILKEAVSPDGRYRYDERRGPDGALLARTHFRSRSHYAEVFGRHLTLFYQRPSFAHLVPAAMLEGRRLLADTPFGRRFDAVLGQLLLRFALPLYLRFDPTLQRVEEELAARPAFRRLLAGVEVVQDLHVFRGRAPRESARRPELSVVVVATVGETAENLDALVRELVATFENQSERPAFELVLVDDGSPEATFDRMRLLEARDGRLRVVTLWPRRGLGGALRAGFDASEGRWVAWLPADGRVPPEVVLRLFQRRGDAGLLLSALDRSREPLVSALVAEGVDAVLGRAARVAAPFLRSPVVLFERRLWRDHGPREDDSARMLTTFEDRLAAAGVDIQEVAVPVRSTSPLGPAWPRLGGAVRAAATGMLPDTVSRFRERRDRSARR